MDKIILNRTTNKKYFSLKVNGTPQKSFAEKKGGFA